MPCARYLWVLPLAAAVVLLRGQTPGSTGQPGTTTRSAAPGQVSAGNPYVDAHLCAGCHPKIAQTYALTGMARSFYRLQPQAATEDYARGNPFYHQLSGTWYAMVKRTAEGDKAIVVGAREVLGPSAAESAISVAATIAGVVAEAAEEEFGRDGQVGLVVGLKTGGGRSAEPLPAREFDGHQ